MAATMSIGILSIPYELQQEIIRHIIRLTDLQSLCLVSKHFSTIFTPALYKHVVLLRKEDDQDWLPRCLTSLSTSRGLQFVQTVRVGHIGVSFNVQHGFSPEFQGFLDKLQDDSLHEFEYGTCNWPILGQYKQKYCCFPSLKEMENIFSHQRKLRILRFDRRAYWSHLLPKAESVLNSLGSLTEIQMKLFLNISETSVNELLSILDLTRLCAMSIDARAMSGVTPIPLLAACLPERLATRLTKLTLSYINFGETHLLRLAKFPNLTHLVMLQCAVNPDFASEEVVFKGPSELKSFFFYSCNTCVQRFPLLSNPEPAYLAHLLGGFQGLETLVVRMNYWMDVHVQGNLAAAIDRHKFTLRCLILDSIDTSLHEHPEGEGSWFFRLANFVQWKEYKNLVQLRMSYGPKTVVAECKYIAKVVPSLQIIHAILGFAPDERRISQTVEYTANQIMREISPDSNISLVSFGDEDSFAPHTCRHWQIGQSHARRCFVRGGTCDHCLRSKVPCDKTSRAGAPSCSKCILAQTKCIFSRTLKTPTTPPDNRSSMLSKIPLFGPNFFSPSPNGRLASAVEIEPSLAKYLVPNLLEIQHILNCDGRLG